MIEEKKTMQNSSANPEILSHNLGGEFLLKETDFRTVFTPDDYSEEQLQLRQAIRQFYAMEIDPMREAIDAEGGCRLVPPLLDKMAKMGFLGIGVAEAYGGVPANFSTQLAVGEIIGNGHSFSTAPGIQASLGIAVVALYGNDAQKRKYLPGIVDCSIKACYCLTEPGSGSDANAAKSRVTLSQDGSHYILNGQKMWLVLWMLT